MERPSLFPSTAAYCEDASATLAVENPVCGVRKWIHMWNDHKQYNSPQSLGLISALRCHAHNSFHWNLFALQLPPDTWSTSAQQVLPLDLCQPRFIHYSLRWPYAELKIQAATSQFFTGQSVLTGKTLECFEIKVSLGEDKWAWRKCLACFHIRIRSKIRRDKRR